MIKFVFILVSSFVLMFGQSGVFALGKCQCGKKFKSKIVGGNEAEINEWPWMVALIQGPPWRQICGASIINDLYVLTAAHCVQGTDAKELMVLLGDHNLGKVEGAQKALGVRAVKVHSNYNTTTLANDIALLKLKSRIKFSRRVAPICLPPNDPKAEGKDAIVTGWGRLSFNGNFTAKLMEVKVPVLKQSKCRQKYANVRGATIRNTMICAGKNGKDSCQGDSGGPLVFKGKSNTFSQIGVVSFGISCAQDFPGVYTRVSKYKKWVKRISKAGNFC